MHEVWDDSYGRVTPGDCSPEVPTDPDMPNSGIVCSQEHKMPYVARPCMW
jgi:hypothetical protein